MSVKNDFQQNDVERCLNRDNSMYIHICVFRHSTIQCIYVNINIYIYTHVCMYGLCQFPKICAPKKRWFWFTFINHVKKDSPVLTVYK